MDGGDDLSLLEAIGRCSLWIDDSYHRLHLQVVISRAKGPHLAKLALLGKPTDHGRISPRDLPFLLNVDQVFLHPIAPLND
ncbi:unnamed protein product, partial [marine sediment metagenome]